MTFSGFSFGFWRVMEIITLIPAVGMLAYFVDMYDSNDVLTPRSILVLFIVSVLALAWAVGTLFLYARAKHSAGFVAFVDLLFVGALIGGVYELRGIGNADCTDHGFTDDSYFFDLGPFQISGNRWAIHTDKYCAMLKASWAFGIMNIIFFFLTMIFALLVHRHYDKRDRVVVKRESHYSRGHRGHRSRSPRHSHHSRRGSYV